MCENTTDLSNLNLDPVFINSAIIKLKQLAEDGLVVLIDNKIEVTSLGMSFIRNVSAAIDLQLWKKQLQTNTFSKAI